MSHEIYDFAVYNRSFCCDLPAARQRRKVLNLYRRMLDTGDAPGVQMKWHCIFDQEKEYVAEAAQRGYFSLCSTNTPNLTIHGDVGDPEMVHHQPLLPKEKYVAEKGKTYVCLYNSDGDATWAVNSLQLGNWMAEERGKFKFGWDFLPLSVKLMTAQMQYFHETKTENDCFWGSVIRDRLYLLLPLA